MDTLTAIIHKQAWKSMLMDRYATALLEAALDLNGIGRPYFNNDDVTEQYQPNDKTTVGTVFKLLSMEHLIAPWRGSVPELDIYGGMRRSSRPCTNGHRNQLYTLGQMELVTAWMQRHGVDIRRPQLELNL